MLQRTVLRLSALILFQGIALADRGPYTFEMVENADIIGIWSKANAMDANGSISLESPEMLLKGSMDLLPAKLAPGTSSALKNYFNNLKEKDDRLILFVGVPRSERNTAGGTASLLQQLPYNRNCDSDAIQLKALKRAIGQVELAQRWSKLGPKVKLEYSDIIVSGHIIHDEWAEDSIYSIHISKIYRGMYSEKRMEVATALQDSRTILPGKLLSAPEVLYRETKKEPNEGGGTRSTGNAVPTGKIKGPQALFFIQRYYGTGPDYLLMGAVDVNKAGQYLSLLK